MTKGVIYLAWGIIFLLVSERVSSEMRAKVSTDIVFATKVSKFFWHIGQVLRVFKRYDKCRSVFPSAK